MPAAAVALDATPDGGFVWVTLDGELRDQDDQLLATVEVSTEGQRGLLGVTSSTDGRIFIGYTDAELRLTAAEIVDGESRVFWSGPESVNGGNGGRLVADPDGSVIYAVGLLNDRAGQADPTSLSGKLIRLDPDAPPDQAPTIISGPWNNPFAFDIAADGTIWVADNDPSDGDERLARGDLGFDPDVAYVFPEDSAPTGLSFVDDATVLVCTYNTRQLVRFDVADDKITGQPVIEEGDCRLDVTVLSDGSVAVATGTRIEVRTS